MGPPKEESDYWPGGINFNGQRLERSLPHICDHQWDERDLFASLQIPLVGDGDFDIVVLTIQLPMAFGHDINRSLINRSVIAFPPTIEAVFPMAERMCCYLRGPILFILVNVSMLPCEHDMALTNDLWDDHQAYERTVENMLVDFARLVANDRFRLIIVDNEATLGKKNRALLQRLFYGVSR